MSELLIIFYNKEIFTTSFKWGVGYHSLIKMNQKDILNNESFKILKYYVQYFYIKWFQYWDVFCWEPTVSINITYADNEWYCNLCKYNNQIMEINFRL